jgi:hypothetical protein
VDGVFPVADAMVPEEAMNALNLTQWEVLALLDGRMTEFTRPIAFKPGVEPERWEKWDGLTSGIACWSDQTKLWCPYHPGPVLLRETWVRASTWTIYRADIPSGIDIVAWRSSSSMQQWAIRPAFRGAEIVKVWACKLGEIMEDDAMAAGVEQDRKIQNNDGSFQWRDYSRDPGSTVCSAVDSFQTLWNLDHPRQPWRPDLWVWRGRVKLP